MKIRTDIFSVVLGGVLLTLSGLFPGDIPWINDEPRLIAQALESNQAHQLARLGLQGTMGVAYGPVPTWIYQIFLRFTHNLLVIVFVKTLLTGFCIWKLVGYLQKQLQFQRSPLFLTFLSPYLYFYARLLWDNCFLIPLSSLFLAAYVYFVRRPSLTRLAVLTLTTVGLIHVHLMSLMVIFAVGFCLLRWDRSSLKTKSRLGILLLGGLACLPYGIYMVRQLFSGSGSRLTFHPFEALVSVLSGFRFFSFGGFFSYFTPELSSPWFSLLKAITIGGAAMGIRGIYLGISNLRNLRDKPNLRDRLDAVCLLALFMAFLFYSFLRIGNHPHYHNAIWIAEFYLLWRAYDHDWKKARGFFYYVYVPSLVALLFVFINYVHDHGGNRGDHYGATLKNQIEVARTLALLPRDQKIIVNVSNIKTFPWSMETLVALERERISTSFNPKKTIVEIDYIKNGWIGVISK